MKLHTLAKQCDDDLFDDSDIEADIERNRNSYMTKQRCKQKNASRCIVADKKKRQECSNERDASAGTHVTNNITYNINNMGPTFNFNSTSDAMGGMFMMSSRLMQAGNFAPNHVPMMSNFAMPLNTLSQGVASQWPPNSMPEVTSMAQSLLDDGGNNYWVQQYMMAYCKRWKDGVILHRSEDGDDKELNKLATWVKNQRYTSRDNPVKQRLLDLL
eukprot:scaffold3394_cov23-Cyclotella_meneghiniana.AAC.1